MDYLSKRRLRFIIPVIMMISTLSLIADYFEIFEVIERKTIDIRMRICRSEKIAPSEIVLILIDESSLSALNAITGRWPWPRDIHADIIDFLSFCGARSILMDIMFTENELSHDRPGMETGSHDMRLVESTRAAGNIVHGFQVIRDKADEYNRNLINRRLPDDFIQKFSIQADGTFPENGNNNVYLPFTELREASNGLGVVSFSPDRDGVYRSEKLIFNYQGHFFPALSFVPLVQNERIQQIVIRNKSLLMEYPDHALRIPLTSDGEYFINMYGKFQTYSISGVLLSMYKIQKGEMEGLPVEPHEFKDKIVFIGASAAGVEDLKNTPMGSAIPGVFLHASIFGNIRTGDFLVFKGLIFNFIVLFLMLMAAAGSICFLRKTIFQTTLSIAFLAGYMALSLMLFQANIVVNVIIPVISVAIIYFSSFAFIGIAEGKEKRKVKNILGQYVSPAMLSAVLEKSHEEYLKAEVGTRETLTIFFSDIRGFTSITEQYEVEKVVELLNTYLSLMVNIIFVHQGTLDKFIGDAIVAFWGAPVRLDDHHYKAVTAAIQMKKSLKSFNQDNRKNNLPPFHIGIGIHTGEVILGNIGSSKKLDYTIIGDSVNLTSRLEGLTKTYQCEVIISHETYIHVKDSICCRMLDNVMVKGKKKPIVIYEVIDEKQFVNEEALEVIRLTETAFQDYCRGRFESSIALYRKILAIRPDDYLSRMFLERCSQYLRNPPPPDWNGAYVMTTK
ncbi:MAG: adenylate/guanylate cyclase domain-containing protein [Desulfobacteraceae bacterium]|nr:MAG: adenylate/guanylate cyclase domain-containing protein [Desulfobacteraceae bacterium]